MMWSRGAALTVGAFIIAAVLALVVLAFKVSSFTMASAGAHYDVTAQFDDIGNLKVRAPIRIAGVTVGRVVAIGLDKNSFRATVTMELSRSYQHIPLDSSASILTAGLLGANYIGISPGFDNRNIRGGDEIQTTHSALILENLIGQLIYSKKDDAGSASSVNKDQAATIPPATAAPAATAPATAAPGATAPAPATAAPAANAPATAAPAVVEPEAATSSAAAAPTPAPAPAVVPPAAPTSAPVTAIQSKPNHSVGNDLAANRVFSPAKKSIVEVAI